MIAKAERDFGSVDILVNNAGIQHVAPVEEFPIEQWDSIIAITSPRLPHDARCRARHEEAQVGAHHQHLLGALAQGLALQERLRLGQARLAGFTKTVALELAEHGVTSNAISPGFVWTPLVEKQIPDLAKSETARKRLCARNIVPRDCMRSVYCAVQPPSIE